MNPSDRADIDSDHPDSSSLGCSPSSASTRQDDLDPGVAEIGSDFASEDRRRRGDRGSSSKVEVEVSSKVKGPLGLSSWDPPYQYTYRV